MRPAGPQFALARQLTNLKVRQLPQTHFLQQFVSDLAISPQMMVPLISANGVIRSRSGHAIDRSLVVTVVR